ncbi:hypothetical protein U91I_01641 [alpha proteobacterium U9-1i]|nr:hypothetical protein U91I_01641 [alpha proteobacterium U9-1i]
MYLAPRLVANVYTSYFVAVYGIPFDWSLVAGPVDAMVLYLLKGSILGALGWRLSDASQVESANSHADN